MPGGRGQASLINSYFRKPWLQDLLASYDPRKKGATLRPEQAVAQIINVKEMPAENNLDEEEDEKIVGSAELHDKHIRANAMFTAQAVEEFEKEEEKYSGCEFEHLPNCIVVLKELSIIPQISEQLCECNLVLRIEAFCLWSVESPTCNFSSLTRATCCPMVARILHRLWSQAQCHGDEDTGNISEVQTNSDPQLTYDLSQLVAEAMQDSCHTQCTQADKDVLSPSLTGVTKTPASPLPVPLSGPSSTPSPSRLLTPGSFRGGGGPRKTSDGSSRGEENQVDETAQEPQEGTDQGERDGSLTWKQVHQLASWVFEVPLGNKLSASSTLDDEELMKEVERVVTRCLETLPDDESDEEESGSDDDDDNPRGGPVEKSRVVKGAQLSPAQQSPIISRRKSRRGRKKGLAMTPKKITSGEKMGMKRTDSLSSTGQEREERLMYERICRHLPTTVIVTMAQDEVEPLQPVYRMDVCDDYDAVPDFSAEEDGPRLQEWHGDYDEVIHDHDMAVSLSNCLQSSNSGLQDNSQTPTTAEDSRHQIPSSASMDSLSREASKEVPDIAKGAQAPPHSVPEMSSQVTSMETDHEPEKSPAAVGNRERRQTTCLHTATVQVDNETVFSKDKRQIHCAVSDQPQADAVTSEAREMSQPVGGDVARVAVTGNEQTDSELGSPMSVSCPTAETGGLTEGESWKVSSVMPGNKEDCSQSDTSMDLSGGNDFTLIRCSIDDNPHQERNTTKLDGGLSVVEEGTDIESDTDIFSLFGSDQSRSKLTPEESNVAREDRSTSDVRNSHFKMLRLMPEGDNAEVHVAADEITDDPNISLLRYEYDTHKEKPELSSSKDGVIISARCRAKGISANTPSASETHVHKRQRIVSYCCEDRDSLDIEEVQLRHSQQNCTSLIDGDGKEMDILFPRKGMFLTSTQKGSEESVHAARGVIHITSSEGDEGDGRDMIDSTEASTRASAAEDGTSMSPGWISKQDMIVSKCKMPPDKIGNRGVGSNGIKGVSSMGASSEKQTDKSLVEPFSVPSSSSGSGSRSLEVVECEHPSLGNDAGAVGPYYVYGSSEELVHSLVNSSHSQGSSGNSSKVVNPSVTPVLFSSGESTKVPSWDCAQRSNARVGESAVEMESSEAVRLGDPTEGIQDTTEVEEEPMSIGTPVENSPSMNLKIIHLPISSTDKTDVVNSSAGLSEKFTRIRRSSPTSSKSYVMKEVQSESCPRTQSVNLISPSGDSVTGTSLKNYVAVSTNLVERTEIPTNVSEDPTKMRKRQTSPRVTTSKIYMGSGRTRKLLTANNKRKKSAHHSNANPSKKFKDESSKINKVSFTVCSSATQQAKKCQSNSEVRIMNGDAIDLCNSADVDSENDESLPDVLSEGILGNRRKTRLRDKGGERDGENARTPQPDLSGSDPKGLSTVEWISPTQVSRTEPVCLETSGNGLLEGRRKKKKSSKNTNQSDGEGTRGSPVFPLPTEDRNQPSSRTESMMMGTHLPSSGESSVSSGESALLEWGANYLLGLN